MARIRPITLDASKDDGYSVTMWTLVEERLRKKRIDPVSCLYRGFDAQNMPRLLETGQDNLGNKIYCSTFEEIVSRESGAQIESAIDYANAHSPAGLIVYNSELVVHLTGFEYRIKGETPREKLDAILAVFKWAHNFSK